MESLLDIFHSLCGKYGVVILLEWQILLYVVMLPGFTPDVNVINAGVHGDQVSLQLFQFH